MTKEAEETLAICAKALAIAKFEKAKAEEAIKNAEKTIKDTMAADNSSIYQCTNGYTLEIRRTAPTKVVDTAKLKEDGLFEKYSKDRAGFEQVGISNPDDEFLCGLNDRRKKHIEDGKKQ